MSDRLGLWAGGPSGSPSVTPRRCRLQRTPPPPPPTHTDSSPARWAVWPPGRHQEFPRPCGHTLRAGRLHQHAQAWWSAPSGVLLKSERGGLDLQKSAPEQRFAQSGDERRARNEIALRPRPAQVQVAVPKLLVHAVGGRWIQPHPPPHVAQPQRAARVRPHHLRRRVSHSQPPTEPAFASLSLLRPYSGTIPPPLPPSSPDDGRLRTHRNYPRLAATAPAPGHHSARWGKVPKMPRF